MGKIEFKIDGETCVIFINKEHLAKICSFSGKLEKGGYIFSSRIKGTNEYIVELLTVPHKNDLSLESFIKFSRKHKRLAKKIQRANRNLYEIGFYHTHPNDFGCKPSKYDLDQFSKVSKEYKISLFIIGVRQEVNIFVYSQGKPIAKERIWIF